MTTVNSTTANSNILQSLTGGATASTTGASATTSASDLQSSFLTMLTTQLQNQDPMNPMDNAQMTSQLAQISTVQGIQSLNSTLTQLMSSYNTTQALQAASAIGSKVLVNGSNLTLSSGSAVGGVTLSSAADKVAITIKDSTGKVIQTEDLGAQSAGNVTFSWDGKNTAGTQVGDGTYSISVAASKSGVPVTATPIQVGTVSAVVRSGSSYVLELSDGSTAAFDSVLQFM